MKTQLKIVVIGAGSFVFGPSVLLECFHEQRICGLDLCLVDLDPVALEIMTAVGRRLARDSGIQAKISSTPDRAVGLQGADYVICCAAPQMRKRHAMDHEIVARMCPGVPMGEFGGLTGLSYSLRQMAFVRELVRDIRSICPRAWLLSVSNPLPRVCQAAYEAGEGQVRVAGFCDNSLDAYPEISQILGFPVEDYPFTEAKARWHVQMAGLNHFSWLLKLDDATSGHDLRDDLLDGLRAGRSAGNPRTEALALETGTFLAGSDGHVATDFLRPTGQVPSHPPFHGDLTERASRLRALENYARGSGDLSAVAQSPAWEKPVAFANALSSGHNAYFASLNLLNTGQMPGLPADVFVQTECTLASGAVSPHLSRLPDSVLPWCQQAAGVTRQLVKTGQSLSLVDVAVCVELDPTIIDKRRGFECARVILETHADMIGNLI